MKLESIICIICIVGSFGKSDLSSTEQPQLFLTSNNITRKLRIPRSHMTISQPQFADENLEDTLTVPYQEDALSKLIPYLIDKNEKESITSNSKLMDTVIIPELNEISTYWSPLQTSSEMRGIPLYWITRGRQEAAEEWENMKKGIIREPLYVDEPSWILVAKGEKNLSERDLESTIRDPFWVSRGRRQDPTIKNALPNEKVFWEARGRRNMKDKLTEKDEHFWVSRGKRGNLKIPSDDTFWAARGKRGKKSVLSSEDPFWAPRSKHDYVGAFPSEDLLWVSRAKRGYINQLTLEDPFWASRGKRGNINGLLTEDQFWVSRGKRGNLNTLSREDPFWVARGKKNEENYQVDSNGKKKRQATPPEVRGLGKAGTGDPFWVSRGKREDYDYYDEDNVK